MIEHLGVFDERRFGGHLVVEHPRRRIEFLRGPIDLIAAMFHRSTVNGFDQRPGHARHPDAADADEVDPTDLFKHVLSSLTGRDDAVRRRGTPESGRLEAIRPPLHGAELKGANAGDRLLRSKAQPMVLCGRDSARSHAARRPMRAPRISFGQAATGSPLKTQ